ncbi:MAG: GIY-YIG nuclease family protein [Candidatus Omnitrophota bacterium]
MKYVYLLKSIKFLDQKYIGITSDIEQRLREHNEGKCQHTSKYLPWKIETYICFQNDNLAVRFEAYLKSGSGRAFAKRHFLSS